MEKKLYTLIVHSENIAGLLNQITSAFTRRQINIESLNVSASSIEGIHRYTITTWTDEGTIARVTRQIEKKVDVLKANYYTDDEIFIQDIALYKLSSPMMLNNKAITETIRRYNASIIEVNTVYCVLEKSGSTEEIQALNRELSLYGCLLQYVSSGRIAVTKSNAEQVTAFLESLRAHEKQNT
jgi:acetolactate synthase-1/3 small subunit